MIVNHIIIYAYIHIFMLVIAYFSIILIKFSSQKYTYFLSFNSIFCYLIIFYLMSMLYILFLFLVLSLYTFIYFDMIYITFTVAITSISFAIYTINAVANIVYSGDFVSLIRCRKFWKVPCMSYQTLRAICDANE